MKELLYLEIPTPDTVAVRKWLQTDFAPEMGKNSSPQMGFA